MNQAGADWRLIVYGDAMHDFTHKHGPALPGVAYHAPSDARSAIAIQNFLDKLLSAGPLSRMRTIPVQSISSS